LKEIFAVRDSVLLVFAVHARVTVVVELPEAGVTVTHVGTLEADHAPVGVGVTVKVVFPAVVATCLEVALKVTITGAPACVTFITLDPTVIVPLRLAEAVFAVTVIVSGCPTPVPVPDVGDTESHVVALEVAVHAFPIEATTDRDGLKVCAALVGFQAVASKVIF